MNDLTLNKEEIIFEGYLYKKSKHLKSMRKRWIVLINNHLYSFKEEKNYNDPTEIFDLTLYDIYRKLCTMYS